MTDYRLYYLSFDKDDQWFVQENSMNKVWLPPRRCVLSLMPSSKALLLRHPDDDLAAVAVKI
jgi:hypothetical protein